MFICTQRQSRYVRLDKSLIKKFNNKLFLFVAFSCHCMFSNTLTLANRIKFPQLGLGTWFIDDAVVAEVKN